MNTEKIKKHLKLIKQGKLYCKHNIEKICDECRKRITGYVSEIRGDVSGIRGDVSGISGNVSWLSGDVSGIRGDISGIDGDTEEIISTYTQEESVGVIMQIYKQIGG